MTAEPKLGFFATLKTFPRSFYMGCIIEMWERLAYYGVRVVMPIYIAQADEPGGLHFTQKEKGSIYAWWFIVGAGIPILSELPLIGKLFSQSDTREEKRDLLVLITPHIIDEGEAVRPPGGAR